MSADSVTNAHAALDRLEREEILRLAKLKQQRQAEVAARDPTENVDAFLKTFEDEFACIKLGTDEAAAAAAAAGGSSVDKTEATTKQFDALVERCARLNETLSSAAVFLPAYTFRQRQSDLSALVAEIGTARNKVAPKKKFSFKDRKKRAAGSAVANGCGGGGDSGGGGAAARNQSAPEAAAAAAVMTVTAAAEGPEAAASAVVGMVPMVPADVLRVVQENGTHSGDVELSVDAVQENFDPVRQHRSDHIAMLL